MTYEALLWDFNGTILDDVQTGIDCTNRLLAQRGLHTMKDKTAYREVFGFPVKDYYARIGFDFSKEPYEDLAVEWVDLYLQEVKNAPLREGVKEVLQFAETLGLPQYILSATEKKMLLAQLRDLGILSYFAGVYGLDNIHAGSKTGLGKALMQDIGCQHALLIGDTVHDADTARAMGIDCVLLCGGHMKKSKLLTAGFPVIDKITDVLPRLK